MIDNLIKVLNSYYYYLIFEKKNINIFRKKKVYLKIFIDKTINNRIKNDFRMIDSEIITQYE